MGSDDANQLERSNSSLNDELHRIGPMSNYVRGVIDNQL